jgi:hypothetical protein
MKIQTLLNTPRFGSHFKVSVEPNTKEVLEGLSRSMLSTPPNGERSAGHSWFRRLLAPVWPIRKPENSESPPPKQVFGKLSVEGNSFDFLCFDREDGEFYDTLRMQIAMNTFRTGAMSFGNVEPVKGKEIRTQEDFDQVKAKIESGS